MTIAHNGVKKIYPKALIKVQGLEQKLRLSSVKAMQKPGSKTKATVRADW